MDFRDYLNKLEDISIDHEPQVGDIVEIEMGDTLVETYITDVTEDGVIVHVDETALTLMIDAKKQLNEGLAEGSHEDEVAKLAAHNERMSGNTPPVDLGLREVGNWAKVGAYGDPIKSAWLNIAKYGVRNNRFKNSVDAVMTAIGEFPDLGDEVYDMYGLNQREVDILYHAYQTVYDQWEELQGQQGVAEAEYQGRNVPLGKPMAGDVKKSKVYEIGRAHV